MTLHLKFCEARAGDPDFPADNLEKVPRLRELLTELRNHPLLSGKLVLKGGTPLNLFYLERLMHARRREPGC